MKLLEGTHIKFIKNSKKAISVSVGIIVIGLISLFFIKGLNFSIDFSGGEINLVEFQKKVEANDIRQALSNSGIEKSTVQNVSGENQYFIKLPDYSSQEEMGSKVKSALNEVDPGYEIIKTKGVGPQIGAEMRKNALMAILGALVAISLYITFRFKFQFAIGAVAALVHDVLFTLGIFSLAQFEISLSTIAAFLTIVGYSLNDTIVLYDRIRENMKTNKKISLSDLIDNSINEVLSRTLVTSLTTLVVVLILSFAFGEVKIFAYAMIIGVITGTFSSIYIAGPVLISWKRKLQKE